MGTSLQPLGPLTRVPVTGEYRIDEVILCSDELAFIIQQVRVFDDGPPLTVVSNDLRVFTVNPTTGALLSNRFLSVPDGFAFDFGSFERLDDETACFAVWDYHGFAGGSGDLVFGKLTADGFVVHRHAPDAGPDSDHFKDTGQQLYVDTSGRLGSVMYFPLYRYDPTTRHFGTSARAVSVNFDTGAAHEFEVTVNMGPDSDRTAYPQYYGTVPLPDGRVLSIDLAGTVRDQDGRVIDRIDPAAVDPEAYEFEAGWIYQLNGTSDLIMIFELDADDAVLRSRFPLWVQRYTTTPSLAPAGGRIMVAHDQAPATTAEELFFSAIVDEMNPFCGAIRVANLPYFDNPNRVVNNGKLAPSEFYIGAQSLHDGSRALNTITVPYPNASPLYWHMAQTPTSMIGSGGRVKLLYTFNWQYPPDGSFDAVWFQLWAAGTEGAAVRLVQRDDGLGAHRHPRLEARGSGSSSQQTGRAPRVNRNNTYS